MGYPRARRAPVMGADAHADLEADMSTSYSPDTLIIDAADPAEIDLLNADLQAHGHDRPLGKPTPIGDGRMVVPVTGGTAAAALRTLDAVRPGHSGRGDAELSNDTVKLDLGIASKNIGHGSSFALIDKTGEKPTEWRAVPAGMRRPVVAVLDTGVQRHDWLPTGTEDDPFRIDATAVTGFPAWDPDLMLGDVVVHPDDQGLREEGHGTFVAGLILAASPTTRILDVRVMTPQGKTRESVVNAALAWLIRYRRAGNPVDVVCMAFGRKPGDTTDPADLTHMGDLLRRLSDDGVQLVASAGNDHRSGEIYPAAFSCVTAVGAGFGGYHATFSNYGTWVDRYRDGVSVFGIFPDGSPAGVWARWSGTSFAAANFAGDLARPHVIG